MDASCCDASATARDKSVEKPAEPASFERAAQVLLRGARGYAHNTFKIDLARRCIVRALEQAAHGTPQSQSSKKFL